MENSKGNVKVQFMFHSKWKNIDDIFVPWDDTTTLETMSQTVWDVFNDNGQASKFWVTSLNPNEMPHSPHEWGGGPIPRMIQDK